MDEMGYIGRYVGVQMGATTSLANINGLERAFRPKQFGNRTLLV